MKILLICPENLQLILQSIPETDANKVGIYTYLNNSHEKWYAVLDYVPRDGLVVFPWTILPKYILEKNFIPNFDEAAYTWSETPRK